METAGPPVREPAKHPATNGRFLKKCINNERDVIQFKTETHAYRDILTFVNLLCEKIHSTSNKVLNHKSTLKNELFLKCSRLLDELSIICDETSLSQADGSAPLRFGHIAFRGWFDATKEKCREFIYTQLAPEKDEQLKEELLSYLSDSFGNKMRIDYGTGHELSFIIFLMGLSHLYEFAPSERGGDSNNTIISRTQPEVHKEARLPSNQVADETGQRLRCFVQDHGWDILKLFSNNYLRLCRKFQIKFRLEPAGSRGVYNMDDFQYLPFLFGSSQLSGVKYIPTKEFYLHDNVDMFKADFIFLEAVDFILKNKRGPFHEHSYTLWCMADLGSWENIYRRIKAKFVDDVLSPFPIAQHLLFGKYILRWQ